MRWRARWSHVTIGLALIAAAAIAAPAIGGQGATTAVKKKTLKNLVKKEVAKQIGKATGPPGPPGANGINGTNGTARAYARVRQHGIGGGSFPCAPACTFDRAKGIAGVTRPFPGSYCVDAPGIDNASVSAAVTVDFGNSSSPEGNASAQTVAGAGSCPSGQFQVATERQPITEVEAPGGGGTVEVAGNAAPADNVAFTIVIP